MKAQPARPSGHWEATGANDAKKRLELEDRVKAALEDANEYSLQGFKACNLQYPVLQKDTCGIQVGVAVDADYELVWEAVVPFRSFYFKHEIDKRDKGKALSICIETTGAKRPPGEKAPAVRSGRGGGFSPSIGIGGMGVGMNMGGRGRQGGGYAPQGSNIMEPLYKSTVTWKVVGLAWKE
jgi:hypothetical protein